MLDTDMASAPMKECLFRSVNSPRSGENVRFQEAEGEGKEWR